MSDFRPGYTSWILMLVVLCQLFSGVRPAEARLRYSFLGEINEDVAGVFLQTNIHRLSAEAEQDLTDKIKINEFINFSNKWEEGKGTEEFLSPSIGVLLKNSYFSLDLQGSTRKNIGQKGSSSQKEVDELELNWASRWKKTIRAPGLRVSVNQRNTYDSLSPSQSDSDYSTLNSSVDWDLLFASLFYSYTRTEIINNISLREQNTDQHFARLSGSHAFLEKKLKISYGHIFRESTSEQVVGAPTGTALISLLIPEIRTGVDSPLDLIELPAASANGLMIDGDLLTPAYPIPQNTIDHTFLMVANGQQVDVIYLYAQDNWGGGVPPTLTNWRLYSTNILGTPWTVEPINIAAITYDAIFQRLVIPVPSVQRTYLKLVVDRNPIALPPIDIAEAELYQSVVTAGPVAVSKRKDQYNSTTFGLDYSFSRNSLLKYTLTLLSEENPGREIESLSQAIKWSYISEDRSYRSALYYNDRRNEDALLSTDTARQTYGLDLQKSLLSTLHLGLGVSREDITVNGQSIGQWDRYSLYLDAQLYPDLQAKLEGQYQKGVFPLITQGQEISSAAFTLSSRLSPNVITSFSEIYDERRLFSRVFRSYTSNLFSSWAVSKWLTTNASAIYVSEETAVDSKSGNLGFIMNLNGKMNFDVNYTVTEAVDVVHGGRASWIWRGVIIKNLDLSANALFSKVEGTPGDEWRLNGVLSYSFAL